MNNITYRDILKNELLKRVEINPSYSAGAFARDIGISKSRLSEVLSKRYGLSPKSAKEILPKLNIGKKESRIFLLSVCSLHSRNKKEKILSKKNLDKIINETDTLIELDTFRVISDWYHFAILELIEVDNFVNNDEYIADRLSISLDTAKRAIKRLIDLNLMIINDKGEYKASTSDSFVPNEVPSDSVKEYHNQILSKAKEEIRLQPLSDRYYQALSISINKNDIPWIKEEIDKFQDQLLSKINLNNNKTDVYNLSIQLFNLTK